MKLDLKVLNLTPGKHDSPEEGMCIMEAVSVAAGEPFTDYPECTDIVISKCTQVLNDRMPSDLRNELLKPLIFRMIGTKGDRALQIKRTFIATDWVVRIILPTTFDLIGKKEWAEKLRLLDPIVDKVTALLARDKTEEVRTATYAASADACVANAYAAAYAVSVDAYAANAANPAAYPVAYAAAYAATYAAAAATNADDRRKIFSLAVDMLIAMIEAK